MREFIRPWKLATFAIGLGLLYAGAFTQHIADWDFGNSTLMGLFTYLLAPSCARIVMRRRWLLFPVAAYAWWFCVDGLYVAWNGLAGLPIDRAANFPTSSCLFWICAFLWYPQASLKEIIKDIDLRGRFGRT